MLINIPTITVGDNKLVELSSFFWPQISVDDFVALRATTPKRICFGSTHVNALKIAKSGQAIGFLNLPFDETIEEFFPWKLFKNNNGFGGYYRRVDSQSEYAEIQEWIERHSDLVFIRSLFTSAVATCEHYRDDGQRSEIGELEHRAKYVGEESARGRLLDAIIHTFHRLHAAKAINGIVSVPSSVVGKNSLPNILAARLSDAVGLPNLTASLSWNGPKSSIKELQVEEKWGALAKVGLSVSEEVREQNLLLIDDMYQSGATSHFVAGCLRAAGAHDLHLLAVSKGRRDTDNT